MRNAVQFATHSVQVRVVASEDDVIISVEDDGPGIPTGEQSAIFRRYYRGKRAMAGIRGTGLGLYLAKEWLTLQGGTIDVDSVEGRGSTFNISMPCKARAGSEGTSNALTHEFLLRRCQRKGSPVSIFPGACDSVRRSASVERVSGA